jgi:hypothetical protein
MSYENPLHDWPNDEPGPFLTISLLPSGQFQSSYRLSDGTIIRCKSLVLKDSVDALCRQAVQHKATRAELAVVHALMFDLVSTGCPKPVPVAKPSWRSRLGSFLGITFFGLTFGVLFHQQLATIGSVIIFQLFLMGLRIVSLFV